MELPSRYNPGEVEDKWYKFWEESAFFHAEADPKKKPFSIVIPPPNVTGILHMGHALNNTIQDILIRYHRMRGKQSLWMPGTDHAGIATQNVVEKAIAKEGLRRQDLGRDKFIEKVWAWRQQYGSTIIHQLKKLGASCDWQRMRFTMDDEYSKAVTEVFVRLYEDGLIYRGNYIINWCPRCQTALSDEEAAHEEVQGSLYYIKYPFKSEIRNPRPFGGRGSPNKVGRRISKSETNSKSQIPNKFQTPKHKIQNYIIVATTRPETMLGDTAVAVNPKDKRYKEFIGKTLILPLTGREIKIIADNMVDAQFGTGLVKVTPAHDPNDYVLGNKHKLDFINVLHPDGRMNENSGKYRDMDRFQARKAILEDLKEKDLIEKIEPHRLSAGHCYRCHTIIEPYLSKQWFVKMKPLAGPAIEAAKKGKVKFYPRRWTKVYINWMENIQDWCISRQIWWGHRIPVYYCRECMETGIRNPKSKIQSPKIEKGVIVTRIKPEKCPACSSFDIYQDEDVLDTWFSSWLWPFSTMGWPVSSSRQSLDFARDKQATGNRQKSLKPEACSLQPSDLRYFYPTSVLVTAPEIIFFWVARMIMAGMKFMKEVPFRDVYIHGTVRDLTGKKMSKSLGNIIDPLEIIEEFGADALRFSIISATAAGQDVFLSEDKFLLGRNFANKIWNASRLILMNLEPANTRVDLCEFFKKEDLSVVNRWILSRFYSALKQMEDALAKYNFNGATNILYGFFWHEFCDWYLEIIKPDIKDKRNQIIMSKILEKFLRALHPFMPFISEEIWQKLPHEAGSIMAQNWPHIQTPTIDKKLERDMQYIFNIIVQIRNMRSEVADIKPGQQAKVSVYPHVKSRKSLIKDNAGLIIALAKLKELQLLDVNKKPPAAKSAVTEDVDLYLHFSGLIDIARERQKIEQEINQKVMFMRESESKLKNQDFIDRAPKEIIEKEKERKDRLDNEVKRLEEMLNGLL